MKKFIIITLISNILFFYSCGNQNPPPVTKTGETKTIRDCIGRDVEIPVKVKRIGCLYAFSGHVVTMLGKGKNIIACVNGLKRDKILLKICPSIKNAVVPKVNGALNIEELVRVKPDIVFVRENVALNDSKKEKFKKFNIPILVVEYNNIQEQKYAIKMIGDAIGAPEKAQSFNKYYDECISRVSKITKNIPDNKRVRLYHSVNEPVKTDSAGTLQADWTKIAGAINVSVDVKSKKKNRDLFVSIEEILLWNPDVIIANEDGVKDFILKDIQWKNIKAVKNKKVYQMPNGISRWGHPGSIETPLAILWTTKTLYPENSKSINLKLETYKFYKKFFNLKLTDKMVTKVLSGKGMRKSKNLNSKKNKRQ
jgi:iron complex transport system substrate-binding protein